MTTELGNNKFPDTSPEKRAARGGIISQIWPSIAITIAVVIITGGVYPLVVTGLAQMLFPHQANGSLIDKTGHAAGSDQQAVGSYLIGQWFDQPQYFWPRPSATDLTGSTSISLPYNAAQSGGSNLSPANDAWVSGVKSAADTLQKADPDNKKPIPIDLVTASASGLDPNISIDAAQYQISRIAKIRGIDAATLQKLVTEHTENRILGVLGENVVNVLALNLALDQAAPYTPPATVSAGSTTSAATTAAATAPGP